LLTAVAEETDRVIGLEMGADDYLTKPFNPRELLARIKVVLRRTHALPPHRNAPDNATVSFAGWRLDLGNRELLDAQNNLVQLSTGEYKLLVAFIDHANLVLSRDQLLDLTQGRAAKVFDRSIDNQVSRLRRKLSGDTAPGDIIKTVRGGGYLFVASIERS
jgi:two-component system, OmpR family, response regulator